MLDRPDRPVDVTTATLNRNHTIDLLRFVFSFVIVSFHMISASDIMTGEAQKNFYFFHGNAAVEFFFLVSGFLMAMSADRQIAAGIIDIGTSSARFMLRKIKSFFLPMVSSWIPCFIIYTAFTADATALDVVHNLEKSVFELLFLKNAGFKGYYVMGQAWYISAMLLTMVVCYPLLLKLKNVYLYCVAPAAAAFLLGYLNHEYTSYIDVSVWVAVVYKSQIRAFGVINMGVFLYAVYRKFREIALTEAGKWLVSGIELFGYGFGLYYMCAINPANRDAVVCMFIGASVLITFSQPTWLRAATEKIPAICSWFGTFSLYLYLCHFAVCKKIIPLIVERFGIGKKSYLLGMVVIVALSFVVMSLKKLLSELLPYLRRILVQGKTAD